MKITLYLLSLLFFVFACDTSKKAKTTDVEKSKIDTTLVSIDSSAIPVEYSAVDSLPLVDSIVFVEPKNPLEYMTIEEKSMIDEINLLRADPQAYASFIDEYVQKIVTDPTMDSESKNAAMAAAGKLIIELQTLEPLPALLTRYKLYQVAKSHGLDMVERKVIDPIGSDGSHPYQRIREGADMDGTENLIAGYATVRDAILSRLIYSGGLGENLGFSLLDPEYEFIACYKAEKVGDIKNVWVQLFAFSIEEEDEYLEEEILIEPAEVVEEMTITSAIVLEEEVSNPAWNYSFMSREEKVMIDEINLLRTNPVGYIQFVNTYVIKYENQYSANDEDFKKAVKELNEELKNMEPLSQLQPNEKLYNVAKAHGLDNKMHNRLDHIGSDKSDPFDRVRASGLKNYIDKNGYFAPNENLVGGEDNPRESVVALLIDSGVSSRGHRRALLEPHWKYVACYKIGVIENMQELEGQEMDDMNNCWVQLFAKD